MSAPATKEQHEIAVGRALLQALGYSPCLRHGQDGVEPDLICSVGDQCLGIEIATAYYSEHHAKLEWEHAREIAKTEIRRTLIFSVERGTDLWILSSVQGALDEKCRKLYSGVDVCWLCIEQHAQLADRAETEGLIRSLVVKFESPICAHLPAGKRCRCV